MDSKKSRLTSEELDELDRLEQQYGLAVGSPSCSVETETKLIKETKKNNNKMCIHTGEFVIVTRATPLGLQEYQEYNQWSIQMGTDVVTLSLKTVEQKSSGIGTSVSLAKIRVLQDYDGKFYIVGSG